MDDAFITRSHLPDWFSYPIDFTRAIEAGIDIVGPWKILSGRWLIVRHEGLRDNFPGRDLVPFARRIDNDDVACWEAPSSVAVQVIHDFCTPGWEQRETYSTFQAWLAAAELEAKDFDD